MARGCGLRARISCKRHSQNLSTVLVLAPPLPSFIVSPLSPSCCRYAAVQLFVGLFAHLRCCLFLARCTKHLPRRVSFVFGGCWLSPTVAPAAGNSVTLSPLSLPPRPLRASHLIPCPRHLVTSAVAAISPPPPRRHLATAAAATFDRRDVRPYTRTHTHTPTAPSPPAPPRPRAH